MQQFCPNGVNYKKLGEVAEIGTGNSDRKESVEDGIYPFYVRSKDVLRINHYEYDETAIVIPGEGGIGEIFHYVQGKYALHQRAYRVHIFEKKLMPRFCYYYMFSFFKKYIYSKAVSSTVSSIRKPMLLNFLVPIPPLSVQKEIVRILDNFTELTAELRAELRAELTSRKKQYEYYSKRFFTSASQKLVSMSELADFVYGFTAKASDVGDTRYIRITDITEQGTLSKECAKYITLNENAKHSIISRGDLIVARTGATFGKTLYFEEEYPAVYASFLIKIIPDSKKLNSKYYWHFTKSILYWNQANKLVSKGGQPQFNSPALKLVKIPLPSLEEQQRIVDILDCFDKLCNDISEGLSAEIEARQKQYEYYRDKLLTFKPLEEVK